MIIHAYADFTAAARPLPDVTGPSEGPAGSAVLDWLHPLWRPVEFVVEQQLLDHEPVNLARLGGPAEPQAGNAVLLAVVALVVAAAAIGLVLRIRRRLAIHAGSAGSAGQMRVIPGASAAPAEVPARS